MKVGYARVSTEDQSLDLQIAALEKAGCQRMYYDHGVSGARFCRPGLASVLREVGPGDTVVVWRLDRLGRSLRKLVELVDELGRRGVEFVSLNESIDTTSSGGVLMFHMMAALAQFERSLISERTRAGMAAARMRGKRLGRRRALSPEQCDDARRLLQFERLDVVAAKLNVHPSTLRRSVLVDREEPAVVNKSDQTMDPG